MLSQFDLGGCNVQLNLNLSQQNSVFLVYRTKLH